MGRDLIGLETERNRVFFMIFFWGFFVLEAGTPKSKSQPKKSKSNEHVCKSVYDKWTCDDWWDYKSKGQSLSNENINTHDTHTGNTWKFLTKYETKKTKKTSNLKEIVRKKAHNLDQSTNSWSIRFLMNTHHVFISTYRCHLLLTLIMLDDSYFKRKYKLISNVPFATYRLAWWSASLLVTKVARVRSPLPSTFFNY